MPKLLTGPIREWLKAQFSVRQYDAWACSELGRCLRWQWFRRTEAEWEPPKNVLNMMRSFEVGNAVDAMVKRWLIGTFGDEFTPDVEVRKPEWDLLGHMDGLHTKPAVIEVKSAASFSYSKIGDAPEKAYFWKQAHAYLWCAEVDEGILLILNLDSKTWKEIEYTLDWEVIAQIMSDLTVLSEALMRGEPPVPDYECSQSDHRNCPFTKVCRETR